MSVVITIPGEVRGKQRPRATRQGRVFTPAETRNAEAFVRLCAAQAMGDLGPFEEPLMMTVKIDVAVPNSFSKYMQRNALDGLVLPAKKPDLDNVVKLICDALNGIAYADDKQIVTLIVSKRYAAQAKTTVTLDIASA